VPILIALGHELKSPESKHEDLVADHVVEALVTLKSHVPTDATSQYLTQAIVGYRLAGEGIVKDDELKRTSEKLLQHLFTSAPKRRHVATKKTRSEWTTSKGEWAATTTPCNSPSSNALWSSEKDSQE
jgi:hypothetical protein